MAAHAGGTDWAELFMEDTVTTTLHLRQGEVEDAGDGNRYGAGFRLLFGTRVVYGYTNDASGEGLLEVADTLARSQDQAGITDRRGAGGLDFRQRGVRLPVVIRDHPLQVGSRQKLDLALEAHPAAQVGGVRRRGG